MSHIDESRHARQGQRALGGLLLALGLAPTFGAGCGSQDGPIAHTGSALTGASCSVAGDGTGPESITYSPDGRATLITSAQKAKDGSDVMLVEFDLDQRKRLSYQITNSAGTVDAVGAYDSAATTSGKPITVTLHVTTTKDVTGAIDGHALVPFNMGKIGPGYLPVLADKAPLPAVLADVQNELTAAFNGEGKVGDAKGSSCTYGGAAPAAPSLTPQWVPGVPGGPGPGCDDCHSVCAGIFGGCSAAAILACANFFTVPIVGGVLAIVCAAVGVGVCYGALAACDNACTNIGSPCCPVACGNTCCAGSETCLDTGLGLCCPAGFSACPGPHESCFDPHTERCLADGSACALTDACGSACCGSGYHCFDPGTSSCCADSQRCGSACCGIGQSCVTTPGAGQSCCPSERACGTACCAEGQFCNGTTGTCAPIAGCPSGQYACLGVSTSLCCLASQACANSPSGAPLCL